MLPQDPIILLSYINTRLRDSYASLDQLCEDMQVDRDQLIQKLNAVHYTYDASRNRFL